MYPFASQTPQKRISQNFTWLEYFKALSNRWLGKNDEAAKYWLSLLKKDPTKLRLNIVRYLIEGQALQEAIDYLVSQENHNENAAEIKYLLARCYFGQGLVLQAKEAVEEALNIEPEQADFWDLLADCLLELGDWRGATGALDKCLRAEPKRVETIFRMGTIYAYHDEQLEALRCFQGCCQLSPYNPVYWEMKGETHLKLEQLLQACKSFEKALRYGANTEVMTRLAYCYVQTDKIKKGIRYYELVLKYEPDHYDSLCNLAAAYQNQGRSKEALDLLERAQKIKPNDPILLNNLAYTLVHLGRTRKAAEYYKEALELTPEHPLILYNLSFCFAHKGNWEEGIQTLKRLLEINPDHSEGWVLLGNIYDQMEQYDIAIDCYNRALKLA